MRRLVQRALLAQGLAIAFVIGSAVRPGVTLAAFADSSTVTVEVSAADLTDTIELRALPHPPAPRDLGPPEPSPGGREQPGKGAPGQPPDEPEAPGQPPGPPGDGKGDPPQVPPGQDPGKEKPPTGEPDKGTPPAQDPDKGSPPVQDPDKGEPPGQDPGKDKPPADGPDKEMPPQDGAKSEPPGDEGQTGPRDGKGPDGEQPQGEQGNRQVDTTLPIPDQTGKPDDPGKPAEPPGKPENPADPPGKPAEPPGKPDNPGPPWAPPPLLASFDPESATLHVSGVRPGRPVLVAGGFLALAQGALATNPSPGWQVRTGAADGLNLETVTAPIHLTDGDGTRSGVAIGVMILIPPGAAPGAYQGEVLVSAANGWTSRTVQVVVEVEPPGPSENPDSADPRGPEKGRGGADPEGPFKEMGPRAQGGTEDEDSSADKMAPAPGEAGEADLGGQPVRDRGNADPWLHDRRVHEYVQTHSDPDEHR